MSELGSGLGYRTKISEVFETIVSKTYFCSGVILAMVLFLLIYALFAGVLQGSEQPSVHHLFGVGAYSLLNQHLPQLGTSPSFEVNTFPRSDTQKSNK